MSRGVFRPGRVGAAGFAALALLVLSAVPSAAAVGTSWVQNAGSLPTAKEGSTAVVTLSGTGGACSAGNVLVAGGQPTSAFGTAGSGAADAECVSASGATVTPLASLDSCAGTLFATYCVGRQAHALFQVPGTMTSCTSPVGGPKIPNITNAVVVAGGADNRGVSSSTSEVYDPAHDNWYPLATGLQLGRWGLDTGRSVVELQSVGGALPNFMVAGGANGLPYGVNESMVDIFNPTTCTWSAGPSMHEARTFAAMGVLANGTVLICDGFGGSDPTPSPSGTCESLPAGASAWTAPFGGTVGRGSVGNAVYRLHDGSCADPTCQERLPGTYSAFPNGRILVGPGASSGSRHVDNTSDECDDTHCAAHNPLVSRGNAGTTRTNGSTYPTAVLIHAGSLYTGYSNQLGGPVLLCGGYGDPWYDLTDGCEVYHPSDGTQNGSWSDGSTIPGSGAVATDVDPMPTNTVAMNVTAGRADPFMMETCTSPTSTCTDGTNDTVLAIGGQASYDCQCGAALTSEELNRIDRLEMKGGGWSGGTGGTNSHSGSSGPAQASGADCTIKAPPIYYQRGNATGNGASADPNNVKYGAYAGGGGQFIGQTYAYAAENFAGTEDTTVTEQWGDRFTYGGTNDGGMVTFPWHIKAHLHTFAGSAAGVSSTAAIDGTLQVALADTNGTVIQSAQVLTRLPNITSTDQAGSVDQDLSDDWTSGSNPLHAFNMTFVPGHTYQPYLIMTVHAHAAAAFGITPLGPIQEPAVARVDAANSPYQGWSDSFVYHLADYSWATCG